MILVINGSYGITGTSLVVSPANTLPIYAQQNNAFLIEINPEDTEISSQMDLTIKILVQFHCHN